MAAICKIQDAYTMKFPKMYSFDTLHKNPAKLHSEPE